MTGIVLHLRVVAFTFGNKDPLATSVLSVCPCGSQGGCLCLTLSHKLAQKKNEHTEQAGVS